ncbi:MAG: diadenylate cyclase [Actinomycetota bacterium]|nr:diadenylate cyclase [Actinomycetota bacterium]
MQGHGVRRIRDERRLRRLADELDDAGLPAEGSEAHRALLLDEIDRALRPVVHERRVATSGTILDPRTDPSLWTPGTDLTMTRAPVADQPLGAARRFADGLSSWLVRWSDGGTGQRSEWLVFDRPAGSERDLGVLANAMGATIVQRHPSGAVRVAGSFGVLRWEGYTWHHEPPVTAWIDAVTACPAHGDPAVLLAMLEFAVHDLGSMGIGALLVHRPDDEPGPPVEERLPIPPPLRITRAMDLSPLRHALAQVDGAAVFDADGVLRRLGVRLVPSVAAEDTVDALGGTRHTSGRRYSWDDPMATVVVVSEDGPVSVLRNGEILGRSPADGTEGTDDAGPSGETA